MEIPCVYIFDGPRKHVDLLEQLLDVSNNPAIRAVDDLGTARSKQTTSKRKKVKSNDWNKKPRKRNVCNREQKTIRSTRVKHLKKDRLFKIKYVTLLCYCFFLVL